MTQIIRFEPQRIADQLDRLGIRAAAMADGSYMAFFAPDGARPEIRVLWTAEGPDKDFFVIRTTSSQCYTPDEWPRMVGLLNEWNRDYREPKAFLVQAEDSDQARVCAQAMLLTEGGIHDELLDGFTAMQIDCSAQLFGWLADRSPARRAEATPHASELEEWLRRDT